MDFLRDDGRAIGCFANRYMTVVETRTAASTEKSFGMSWWKSLAALERWAESHPTHVAIFGAAMKYLSTLGPAARLQALPRGDGGAGGRGLLRVRRLPGGHRPARRVR